MDDSEFETKTGNGPQRTEQASARLRERLEEGEELAENMMERLESAIRSRPGTSLLVALGAGFVLGRIARR